MRSNRPYRESSRPVPAPARTFMRAMATCVAVTTAFTIGALHSTACNPKETQAVSKTVQDVAKCIDANSDKKPEEVAAICGLEVVPDVIGVITALQAKKKPPICVTYTLDAGKQADGGGPGI